MYKSYFSHTFFKILIFLTISIIIFFSSVSFSIDIVFINQFDVTRLRDYNRILSNLSKEEVKDLTSDILNNEDEYFHNPSNYFFLVN